MNSKDIYRALVGELAEYFSERGYQRVKGTFPSWTKQVKDKFATVWFQVARMGGEFTVEFQYCSSPEPGRGKSYERRRFFQLLDYGQQWQLSRMLPKGDLTANNDYWFLARSEVMVRDVARWFKDYLDIFVERLVAEVSEHE